MYFDIAIIGAGIIGCSIAGILSKYDKKICVIEKEYDVAEKTSGANSGIIHGGFDAKPGTLKARLNVRGVELIEDLSRRLSINYRKTGSLVLAFNESDVRVLKALYKRGEDNSVKDIFLLGKEELFEIEPNISKDVVMALYSKNSGVISPYEFTCATAELAAVNGTEFLFGTEVTGIEKNEDDGYFTIKTNNDKTDIRSGYIINCAGIYADRIAAMAGDTDYQVRPRKGEYLLMDKKAGNIVNHVIFQTPSRMGKGILVSPTAEGNLLLGPNAVDISDKDDETVDAAGLDEVIAGAYRSVPGIDLKYVITTFAGLRSVSSTGDFIIEESERNKGMINVLGIESPGLTAAPAIAEHVENILLTNRKFNRKGSYITERNPFPRIKEMSREKANILIKENPLYGNIICRCETVSEGEIIEAINRPAGARTVDGVKKRTRAGMGRCQGGFCMPKIIEILAEQLGIEAVEITKSGGKSVLLTGKTKEGVTYDKV